MPSQDFKSGSVITKEWLNEVDAALFEAANGVPGAVARGLHERLAEVVSVKDFGALGDGVTNDQPALQLAFNYIGTNGGYLYWPPGTYRTTSFLILTILSAADKVNTIINFGSAKIHYEGTHAAITVIDTDTDDGDDQNKLYMYTPHIVLAGTTAIAGLKFTDMSNLRIIKPVIIDRTNSGAGNNASGIWIRNKEFSSLKGLVYDPTYVNCVDTVRFDGASVTSAAEAVTAAGTITTSTASPTVTGGGTTFLTQVTVGKTLRTTAGAIIGTVLSIGSDSSLTLTANAQVTLGGVAFKIGFNGTDLFTNWAVIDYGTDSSVESYPAPRIIAKSAVAAVSPSDTVENALATITVPAGSMGPNGVLRITSVWSVTNNANVKTARIRLGGPAGTIYAAPALASMVSLHDVRTIMNRNSESSQIGGNGGTASYGVTTNSVVTSAIDTSAATTIVFTAQKATGADVMILESYIVELIPG